MTDADNARIAKALANLDHHMGKLVRIMDAVNENMVAVGKTFNAWLEITEVVEEVVADEQSTGEDTWPKRTIQFQVRRSVEGAEHDDLACTGLLKQLPDGTFEIDVTCPGENTNTWALPPGGPWKLHIYFDGNIYDFLVPSFESGITKVYGTLATGKEGSLSD